MGEETEPLEGATAYGILKAYDDFKSGKSKKGKNPPFWNGKAGQRIIRNLLGHLYGSFEIKDKMDERKKFEI
jgi:hypothetical protein